MSRSALELSEAQIRYFRARRSHLVGDGAPNVVAAARAIFGAQSQQLNASLLGLCLRTAGRPSAVDVAEELLGPEPRLVRTWGQRDTLHLFDPGTDWADVVAARARWAPRSLQGLVASAEFLSSTRQVITDCGGKVTRRDLFPILPASLVEEATRRMGSGPKAQQLAASRPLRELTYRGELCLVEKVGAEQVYADRSLIFPDLPWQLPSALDAAVRLTRRYLATYGPATPQDVAHFFGARVTEARTWLAALEEASALTSVRCEDRQGLVALAGDVEALSAVPPSGVVDWPVRLLPMWDGLLMGHADKSWAVPDEAERKLIWRKAGVVAATVWARGRVVATWSQKKRRRRLTLDVQPLGLWSDEFAEAVRQEAGGVARHWGLEGADVTIEAT